MQLAKRLARNISKLNQRLKFSFSVFYLLWIFGCQFRISFFFQCMPTARAMKSSGWTSANLSVVTFCRLNVRIFLFTKTAAIFYSHCCTMWRHVLIGTFWFSRSGRLFFRYDPFVGFSAFKIPFFIPLEGIFHF